MSEMIVGHCDSRHNGSLILLPYLGQTIFSSDALFDMFTYLLRLWVQHLRVQPSILQNIAVDDKGDVENRDQIEGAAFMCVSQTTVLCCVCVAVCEYMHMAAYFCTRAYVWAWDVCVCAWLMRIYRTSERAVCQVGMEEAQCSCPSSFNVGSRHSSESGAEENVGMIKSPRCSIRDQPSFSYLPHAWTQFFSRLRLDASKTRHPFTSF